MAFFLVSWITQVPKEMRPEPPACPSSGFEWRSHKKTCSPRTPSGRGRQGQGHRRAEGSIGPGAPGIARITGPGTPSGRGRQGHRAEDSLGPGAARPHVGTHTLIFIYTLLSAEAGATSSAAFEKCTSITGGTSKLTETEWNRYAWQLKP